MTDPLGISQTSQIQKTWFKEVILTQRQIVFMILRFWTPYWPLGSMALLEPPPNRSTKSRTAILSHQEKIFIHRMSFPIPIPIPIPIRNARSFGPSVEDDWRVGIYIYICIHFLCMYVFIYILVRPVKLSTCLFFVYPTILVMLTTWLWGMSLNNCMWREPSQQDCD
jgi:hypothetical protein